MSADEANDMMAKVELQMTSQNIVNIMSTEDFSKFAASDLGEAIKRVSGVSVVGGKYAVVRGLGDRYVSSTLNGLPIASPDPDKQAIQLDLFPSGLFEAIEVTKSYTPDQPATSTAGIDLKIKDLPEELFFKVSVSGGYHSDATGNEDFLTTGRVTGSDQWANAADARGLPRSARDFPDDLYRNLWKRDGPPRGGAVSREQRAIAISQAQAITDSLGRSNHAFGEAPEPDYGFKASAGDSFEVFDEIRLGVFGGVNYSRKARIVEDGVYYRGQGAANGPSSLTPEVIVDPLRAVGYEDKVIDRSERTSALSWLVGTGVDIAEMHDIRVHRMNLSLSEDANSRLVGTVKNEKPFSEDGDVFDSDFSESLLYAER